MTVVEAPENTRLKRLLDKTYLIGPSVGVLERDHGLVINRKRFQRLKRELGLETINCKPSTSIADKAHRISLPAAQQGG